MRKVIEKLADFVAKNGRSFEDVTRQRNPENSPFRHVALVTPSVKPSSDATFCLPSQLHERDNLQELIQ